MSFKSNIPEQVLAHPNTRKFVSVMDGVNEVKSDIIFTSLRAYNPALLLDKNWLLKRLGDYGVDFIPMKFPLPVIQQFLLNADIILGTRGSKKGVELFLSVMTLGTVSVNFNSFYADPQVLLLNSLIQGHIVGDTTDPKFYLIGNSDIINPAVTFSATINSKYFGTSYKDIIVSTIKKALPSWLGFSPNKTINITTNTASSYYFHPLLNPYFV